MDKLNESGVKITAEPSDKSMHPFLSILLSWFPKLLLIGVWIFFMRQMQGGNGGAMGFGRSKAKMMNELKGKVTFNNVAGIEEAKEEVEEVVEFLKDPKQELRARDISKNVRCLICQGQTIDDSNSDFAINLKNLIKQKLKEGLEEEQIYEFLISKYGDWIILKPKF